MAQYAAALARAYAHVILYNIRKKTFFTLSREKNKAI